jgi:hypothetical protein
MPAQDMNGTLSFFSQDCVRSLNQIPRQAAFGQTQASQFAK